MTLPAPAPLALHREVVQPGWVDYNGHLNDGFYLVIFSHATDALMDHIGLDAAARAATSTSLFTLEVHLNYQREVKSGDSVRIETQILGHDAKRLHIFHSLYADAGADAAATNEQMLLHVDTRGPKAAPFRPEVLARVAAIAAAHAALPRPRNAGHTIALPAKQPG